MGWSCFIRGKDPLPGLPPNQTPDLGEGEYDAFMETLIPVQIEVAPPPIVIVKWGEVWEGV